MSTFCSSLGVAIVLLGMTLATTPASSSTVAAEAINVIQPLLLSKAASIPDGDPSDVDYLRLLAEKHWASDRAEAILERAAKPPFVGRGVVTLGGHAHRQLEIFRGNRIFHQAIDDAKTKEDRYQRARKILKENAAANDFNLWARQRFVESVLKYGGAKAVDLVIQYPQWTSVAYIDQHATAIETQLRKLGLKKTVSLHKEELGSYVLLRKVAASKNSVFVAMFDDWIQEAKNDDVLSSLVGMRFFFTDGREALGKILQDERPMAVRAAASNLARWHANEKTIALLDKAVAHLVNQQANEVDVRFLRAIALKAHVQSNTKRGKKLLIDKLFDPARPTSSPYGIPGQLITNYPDKESLNALRQSIKARQGIAGTEKAIKFLTHYAKLLEAKIAE